MKKNKKLILVFAVLILALLCAAYAASVLVADDVAYTEVFVTTPGTEQTELQPGEAADGEEAVPADEDVIENSMEDSMEDATEEPMEDAMELAGVEGEIVELGEGYVVLSTQAHGMVQVNFTADTVFEGVSADALAVGQYLFADYDGRMSRSIPAQITGLRVYAVMLSGVVSEVGDGSVTILQDETGMEIVIHLPQTAGVLAAGDHITAATNGAMTMSLPPQTSAAQITVNGK